MPSNTAILGQIVEKLLDSDLSYEDRMLCYEQIIEVFEDFEVKNLEECLDIDRAFDEVWYEKYPELEAANDED